MNIIEISKRFPEEIDAIKFFELKRWGKNPKCAYCSSEKLSKRTKDLRFKCYDCNKTSSVTTKTYLHSTNMELKKWMFAFSIISDAKKGVSALQLQRNLNISYPTAWAMYHKIRDLMSKENDAIILDDIVELDSKIIDADMRKCQKEKKGTPNHIPELDKEIKKYKGKFHFKKGDYIKPCKIGNQKRGEGASEQKIAGVVQREGSVIAHVIKKTSFEELRKIIKNVNKSKGKTVLITDSARANRKFSKIMNHIAVNHFKLYSYRGLNTNTIESFWAIIERQIKGQHHHVDLKYLEKYVSEAVFKFNNRNNDTMFITLIRNAMQNKN